VKRRIFSRMGVLLLLLFGYPIHGLSNVYGQTDLPYGIQPLLELDDQSVHVLIPGSIRPLVVGKEIERFLQELEGMPPDWASSLRPYRTKRTPLPVEPSTGRSPFRAAFSIKRAHCLSLVGNAPSIFA